MRKRSLVLTSMLALSAMFGGAACDDAPSGPGTGIDEDDQRFGPGDGHDEVGPLR